jgi:hypothetical protein
MRPAPPGRDAALGQALLWASHRDRRRPAPCLAEIAPRSLFEVACYHRLAPVLHQAVAGHGDAAPELVRSLDRVRTAALAQHLHAAADLPGLAGSLAEAEVPWAMMKGPVVAGLGYRDPSLRGYVDLDVLVAPGDLGRAIEALLAGGACLRTTDWAWALRTRQCEVGLVLPFGNHLDLHWHPVNRAQARAVTAFDVDAALARARVVAMAEGVSVPALDPVDHLVAVAVHAAWSGGHLLGWSKDIERLATGDPPDWDALVGRARQARVAVPVALMLRRAGRLLGAPVPGEVVAGLLAGHAWSTPMRGVERLASPRAVGRMRLTAQGAMASTRDAAGATTVAMAQEAGAKLGRLAGIRPFEERRRRRADDREEARRAYLHAVALGHWSTPRRWASR